MMLGWYDAVMLWCGNAGDVVVGEGEAVGASWKRCGRGEVD